MILHTKAQRHGLLLKVQPVETFAKRFPLLKTLLKFSTTNRAFVRIQLFKEKNCLLAFLEGIHDARMAMRPTVTTTNK
jgi:hypothetical protein